MFKRRMLDFFDPYDLDEAMGFGRSRYTFDGEVDRSTFATVSNRAFRAHDDVSTALIGAFRRVV
jgi:hypothetical protein